MEQEILHKLQGSEWFRERKNKDKGIALMLIEKYLLEIESSRLTAVIQDASSMDRFWRKCTRDYPALRGKDYETKKQVVQRKQLEYGYEPNFHGNIKKLNTLR